MTILILSVFIISSCDQLDLKGIQKSGDCGDCTPWAPQGCGLGDCSDWEMKYVRSCTGDIFSDELMQEKEFIPGDQNSPPQDPQYSPGQGGIPEGCIQKCMTEESCLDCYEDCSQEGCEGQPCGDNMICEYGSCVLDCPEDWFECGPECVDPQTDENNCGGCGIACAAGYDCVNGQCDYDCAYYGGECTDEDLPAGNFLEFSCPELDLCEGSDKCKIEISGCDQMEEELPNCECQNAHKECIENSCTHLPGWGFCAGEGLVGECDVCYDQEDPNFCFMNEEPCNELYMYGCWWNPEENIDLCQSDEMCEEDCESDGCNGNCPEGCSGNDPDCYCSYSYKNGCCGIGCNFYNDKDCCIVPEKNMVITENTYFCEGDYYLDYDYEDNWLTIQEDNIRVECDDTNIIINNPYGYNPNPTIDISYRKNTTIKGCNLNMTGYGDGVHIYFSNETHLEGMTLERFSRAIWGYESEDVFLEGNKFQGNNPNGTEGLFAGAGTIVPRYRSALLFDKVGDIRLRNNIIRDNAHVGLYLKAWGVEIDGYNYIENNTEYDLLCDREDCFFENIEGTLNVGKTNSNKIMGFYCGDGEVTTETITFESLEEEITIGEECEPYGEDCNEGFCYNCQCITPHEPEDTNCVSNYQGNYVVHLYNWFTESGERDSCSLMTVRSDIEDEEANYMDYIIDDALDCCENEPGDMRIINNRNTEICYHAKLNSFQYPTHQRRMTGCLREYIETNLNWGFKRPIHHLDDELWMWNYFTPEYCCEVQDMGWYNPLRGRFEDACQEGWGNHSPENNHCANPYYDWDTLYVFGEEVQYMDCPGPRTPGLCKHREQPAKTTLATLKTGVCDDWSFAATSLLRKTGYFPANDQDGDLVLSIGGGFHTWNLIYDFEVGKWVVYDYGKKVENVADAVAQSVLGTNIHYCWDIGEIPRLFDVRFEIGHENQHFDFSDYEADYWARENIYGCDLACMDTIPQDGLILTDEITYLCPGEYNLEEGLTFLLDGQEIDGNGAIINCIGPNCDSQTGINTNGKDGISIRDITLNGWGTGIKTHEEGDETEVSPEVDIEEITINNSIKAIKTGVKNSSIEVWYSNFNSDDPSRPNEIHLINVTGNPSEYSKISHNIIKNSMITLEGSNTDGIKVENNTIENDFDTLNHGIKINLNSLEEERFVKIAQNTISNNGNIDIYCQNPAEPIVDAHYGSNICDSDNCDNLDCSDACSYTTPTSGMILTESTTFCPGVFNLEEGIVIGADDIEIIALDQGETQINCVGPNCNSKIGIDFNGHGDVGVDYLNLSNWGVGVNFPEVTSESPYQNVLSSNILKNNIISIKAKEIGPERTWITSNKIISNQGIPRVGILIENSNKTSVSYNELINTTINISGYSHDGRTVYDNERIHLTENIIQNKIENGIGCEICIDIEDYIEDNYLFLTLYGNEIISDQSQEIYCQNEDGALIDSGGNICSSENCDRLECE